MSEYKFKSIKFYFDKPGSMEISKKIYFFEFFTIYGVIPREFKNNNLKFEKVNQTLIVYKNSHMSSLARMVEEIT